MKLSNHILLSALAVAMATSMCGASVNYVRAENAHWEELANLPFPENYPTQEAADILYDEMLFQRAAQLVTWSLPAMVL